MLSKPMPAIGDLALGGCAALMRALGASPGQVFLLLASEAALVTLAGTLFGYALLCTAIVAVGPWAAGQWGIVVSLEWPSPHEWTLLGAVLVAGIAASCVPAWRAYRLSLSDGMMVRS